MGRVQSTAQVERQIAQVKRRIEHRRVSGLRPVVAGAVDPDSEGVHGLTLLAKASYGLWSYGAQALVDAGAGSNKPGTGEGNLSPALAAVYGQIERMEVFHALGGDFETCEPGEFVETCTCLMGAGAELVVPASFRVQFKFFNYRVPDGTLCACSRALSTVFDGGVLKLRI